MISPVIHYLLVIISDQWFLVSSLENMDADLVHSQPQVLWEGAGVALQHVEDGGPIQRPLPDERDVGFIALLFRQVCVFAMFASYVFRTNLLPHVLGNVPFDYCPNERWERGGVIYNVAIIDLVVYSGAGYNSHPLGRDHLAVIEKVT